MEIYLIRHTRVNVDATVCYGNSDVELASTFPSELGLIQQKLPSAENWVIYSSPLKRTLKLAAALFPAEQPVIDNRLRELNFGNWELKKWDEINKEELSGWMNDFVNVPCTGGESYQNLYDRSAEFFDHCISKAHEHVLVISHAGVIRSILSLILKIPLEKTFSLQLDHGKISKIKVHGTHIMVEYINN